VLGRYGIVVSESVLVTERPAAGGDGLPSGAEFVPRAIAIT